MRSLLAAFFLLLSSAVVAAAPAPDPLLQQIIAGARAVPASAIAFERSVRDVSQDKGGETTTRTHVDRWDGQQAVLVSFDNKPPSPQIAADYSKQAAGKPVAGYYRIADFLGNGAQRVADPQGRIVYRATGLPKGSVDVGRDVSADMVAEAVIDTSGAQPFVSRLRLYLPKPLSFFMVARLDTLEIINDYRLGPAGRPTLMHQVRTLAGAQFGKAGQSRAETNYTPLR
jgi:hypothetical protein